MASQIEGLAPAMTTKQEIEAAEKTMRPFLLQAGFSPHAVTEGLAVLVPRALDAAEAVRNEIVGKIDTPKTPGARPDDGPFTREHFARLSKEWDDQRVLPDNAPTWNMDYFQWNGVSAALKIAAEKADA